MNLQQVRQTLQGIFQKELTDGKKRHIVFWYDPEGEFAEEIDLLNLDGVRILRLHDHNAFRTKYEIEKADPHSHFLIYSNQAKPAPRQNWLIDTLKYSIEFSTDKTSVIMRDLGIEDESLRPVFKRYLKFFNSNKRYAKFTSYEVKQWTEEVVHLVVLATLCKVDIANLDEIVKALLIEELNGENRYWQEIKKYGVEQDFWSLVERYYGFTREKKSLKQLMISFMVTHLVDGLNTDVPQEWQSYLLSMRTNSLVFINQFMHHAQDHVYYDQWAERIQDEMGLDKYLAKWKPDEFIHCDTFPIFDQYFVQSIAQNLAELVVQDFDYYRHIITARRKLHWFNQYQYEYEALSWAVTLLETFNQCKDKLKQKTAHELFEDYISEFYLLDQAYRKFYVAYDRINNQECLFPLQELIENTYVNGFIEELSIYWSNAVQEHLTGHWPLPGVKQQSEFFREFVQPHVNREERVFVIISDAFRYEIAQELCDRLNHERKAIAEMTAVQGVVPSYTALGMAALLPYKTLTYDASLNINIDGQSTSGIGQREKILQAKVRDSIALSYRDVRGMKRDQLRKAIQGKKVIYIYHNAIDARGDHAATEHEVFQAAEEAITELSQLINHLVNNVSATHIYITADHGFIYKRSNLQEAEKITRLTEISDLEKRRFMITDQFVQRNDTLTISLDYLFGENSGKYVVTPRGTMRYRRQGKGDNFIHGGAMLQEIVVPVIKYKNDRNDSNQNEVRKVQVKLTSISRKITSMITYLEFFQTDKVEHKKLPLRLKLYFVDEEGERISNENIIIADSQSEHPHERTYKEKFVLKNMKYDKTKTYYLILEDEDQDVDNIYDKIPFIIDIAISDDFGF